MAKSLEADSGVREAPKMTDSGGTGQCPAAAAPRQYEDANPPWLEAAIDELGQREVPGGRDNQRIIEYHATTSLRATHDEVPWCSSFVNWAMIHGGCRGTGSAAAKSWLDWGASCRMRRGAVVVLRRRTGRSEMTHTGYHVALALAWSRSGVLLLGGNQSNAVCVKRFDLSSWEVIACRWPA